jgi:hypothetical protein
VDLDVSFVEVCRPEHLTYLKPWFMLELLARNPSAGRVVYLDPDVVVKCRWEVMESWMDGGVAAVEDVNGRITALHPMRTRWRAFLQEHGWFVCCERDVYVNAGFVGIPREHVELLNVWWEIVQSSAGLVGGLTSLKNLGPNDLFHSADQDALNMALEVVDCPLSWVGLEAMDFAPGGTLLSHAIGTPKPWDAQASLRALRGFPPSAAAREFVRHISSPIPAVGRWRRYGIKADLRTAQLVSRVWRRTP